jgi:hypothetical protein
MTKPKQPKMLGAQPKRTLVAGGFTGSNAPMRRKHYAYSESAIREAANKLLLDRGAPAMQYFPKSAPDFRQP